MLIAARTTSNHFLHLLLRLEEEGEWTNEVGNKRVMEGGREEPLLLPRSSPAKLPRCYFVYRRMTGELRGGVACYDDACTYICEV